MLGPNLILLASICLHTSDHPRTYLTSNETSCDVQSFFFVSRKTEVCSLLKQGSKEELPVLSMKENRRGQFLVDFHARLSALQAFSVCISLLQCSEASIAISLEKGKQKLYSSSLKLLLEEDVRHLIEAVTAEEKKQQRKKRRDKAPPSVLLDPPFSPIGRV